MLGVSLYKPDVEEEIQRRFNTSPVDPRVQGDMYNQALTPMTAGRRPRSPQIELSPTGRSTVTRGEHARLLDWIAQSGERLPGSTRRESSRFGDPRNQNVVDVDRIRLGLDVRTTVCVRCSFC